jgi:nitrite reductase/ring-hydroxylating ferredoxin subunit
MAEFKKVAKLSELSEGQVKGVTLDGQDVALYRFGDEVFATTNICSHEYCVISENNIIDGQEVECTCHGSRFNIKTGENTLPPAAGPLITYKTKIEGDEVLIEV